MVASFAVGDRVQIAWEVTPSDNMIGNIVAVNSTSNIITVNVDTINGPTGIQWTPWTFTLIQQGGSQLSSTGNGASTMFSQPQSLFMMGVGLIAAVSALLFV